MNICKVLFILSFLLLCTTAGISQEIVRVESENAKIYVTPDATDAGYILAQKGDLFDFVKLKKGWVGIKMFSGKVRYINAYDVTIMEDYFLESAESSQLLALCDEVKAIENQSKENAESKYPDDRNNKIAYTNELIDKGILELFRKNKVPATQNTIFTDCIVDSNLHLFETTDKIKPIE